MDLAAPGVVLSLYQEYGRAFAQVGQFALPLRHGFGDDVLAAQGDVGGNAKSGGWSEGKEQILHQFGVSEGRFDEDLGLFFANGALLELLDDFDVLAFTGR